MNGPAGIIKQVPARTDGNMEKIKGTFIRESAFLKKGIERSVKGWLKLLCAAVTAIWEE